MNKLAQYLNQHLLGEVITDPEVRARFATDNSPFEITPDMVVYPRSTNDIRKLMTFCWQLAEKGHKLPVTARGAGTDRTGGAIGKGVSLQLGAHMNTIFELDQKQRLVRVQPGVTVSALQSSLALHGLTIPALVTMNGDATIGGVFSSGNTQPSVVDWVEQIEVVLANGEALQTKRLSKRDLNKKKGLSGFEGDLYRGVDSLIEDNAGLIFDKFGKDSAGYNGLADVKRKDGSFDLMPLIASSQGTLGVVSEMILKADFAPATISMVAAAFGDELKGRDAIDALEKIEGLYVEYFNEELIKRAATFGKRPVFIEDTTTARAVIAVTIHDASVRHQAKKVKKVKKALEQFEAVVVTTDNLAKSDLTSLQSLLSLGLQAQHAGSASLPLTDGCYIPVQYIDTFMKGLEALEKKYGMTFPLYGRPLEGMWTLRPSIALNKVSGKQAVFKLIDDINQLIIQSGGALADQNGEGRLQSYSVHRQTDEAIQKLFGEVKALFDAHGILNPGVKQEADVHSLLKSLRSSYVPSGKDALPLL